MALNLAILCLDKLDRAGQALRGGSAFGQVDVAYGPVGRREGGRYPPRESHPCWESACLPNSMTLRPKPPEQNWPDEPSIKQHVTLAGPATVLAVTGPAPYPTPDPNCRSAAVRLRAALSKA